MNTLLLDTGPIMAYLDRSDADHDFVAPRLDCLRADLVTTGSVVTEAMFLLQSVPNGPGALTALLAKASVALFDVYSTPALAESTRLMTKYADTPMDFADATLVVAAQHLQIGDILTLDERGFRTFRYSRRKRFHLVLQDGLFSKVY